MPRYDFRAPRLFVDAPLHAGATVALDAAQAHYLADVMRLSEGDSVLVFNGRDGEWRAALAATSKKKFALRAGECVRAQTSAGNLHYLFAPLKRARLDYMMQKAVEMGVSRLVPVVTRHTHAERINVARMRANVIEAAEQCGILSLPETEEPVPFARALASLEPERVLIFCDEEAEGPSPVELLFAEQARSGSLGRLRPLAVIIGPEGGFAQEERHALLGRPNTIRIALGPRILRADTAAVAALALVQAALGDWHGDAQ
jgi:16S rRNA (uracil1498-N3)-methyltransferase